MDRFRILALDGGGIRGAFSAAVLAELDRELKHHHPGLRLVDHFDLVCGTSTGGLLALALGLGIEPAEMPDIYLEFGDEIFEQSDGLVSRVGQLWRQLTGAKHDPAGLISALEGHFQDRVLGESSCRLAIPAFDVTLGRIFVFKTAHHQRFRYDIDIPAIQIARSTSAAPTYFPPSVVPAHRDTTYVDGGVWANNPSMVGLVEATSFCGAALTEVSILNIGTTAPVPDFSNVDDMFWKLKLPSLLTSGVAEAAHKQAALLLGSRFHRIDRLVPNDWSSLDDVDHVNELVAAGRAVAVMKVNLEPALAKFLDGNLAPRFEPFHQPA